MRLSVPRQETSDGRQKPPLQRGNAAEQSELSVRDCEVDHVTTKRCLSWIEDPNREVDCMGLPERRDEPGNFVVREGRELLEHPFRVLKRQFGFIKVRYRGLKKNTAQLTTLFGLSNLWMARRQLMGIAA